MRSAPWSREKFLQPRKDSEGLPVAFEATVGPHAIIERGLASVAEGGMPEIMAEPRGLDEAEGRQKRNGLVTGIGRRKLAHHAAGDLRNLQRVGHSRAIKIAVAQIEDLRLALEPSEGSGMDDAAIIDVEFVPSIILLLRPRTTALQPNVGHESLPNHEVARPASSLRRGGETPCRQVSGNAAVLAVTATMEKRFLWYQPWYEINR